MSVMIHLQKSLDWKCITARRHIHTLDHFSPTLPKLRWSRFTRPLDSRQEMCHCHGGWHSVSSFCFAVLTQTDEHPRVCCWLVGIVVVGQELLSELALVAVVELREKKTQKRQITWNSWLFEGRDKTKMPGKFSVGGILNLYCLRWFLSNNCIISDRGVVIVTVLFQPYFTKKRERRMMEVRQNSVRQAPVRLFSPTW